jgi:hypothetical protein
LVGIVDAIEEGELQPGSLHAAIAKNAEDPKQPGAMLGLASKRMMSRSTLEGFLGKL